MAYTNHKVTIEAGSRIIPYVLGARVVIVVGEQS